MDCRQKHFPRIEIPHESNRALEDAGLLRLTRASYKASHGIYGAPPIFLDLREAGETRSKHRLERMLPSRSYLAKLPRG